MNRTSVPGYMPVYPEESQAVLSLVLSAGRPERPGPKGRERGKSKGRADIVVSLSAKPLNGRAQFDAPPGLGQNES